VVVLLLFALFGSERGAPSCERPSFGLRYAVFQATKDRLLHCVLPSFARQALILHKDSDISLLIHYEVIEFKEDIEVIANSLVKYNRQCIRL
jgi:hypothetical protein